ncbi:MAG: hypothetical protein Kow0092_01880 [Deferrisomatales bacterium]
MKKTYLLAPGPTPVPPQALLEMALAEEGPPVPAGAGVAAALQVLGDRR